MQLLVATTNEGKLNEYRSLLAGLPLEWWSLADVGLQNTDVEESGSTFVENALLKARTYQQLSNLNVLSDDSGLCVDYLNGAPGIYSARYAATPQARIERVLTALSDVPEPQRGAQFVCVVVLVTTNNVTLISEGVVQGMIAEAPIGEQGFGYDPIFRLTDGRTVAQLSATEKNALSHRGVAVAKLRPLVHALAESSQV